MLNGKQSIHDPRKYCRMFYSVCLVVLLLLCGTNSALEDDGGSNKEAPGKQRQSTRERQDSNHRQSGQVQNISQNDMALPPQPTVSLLSSTSARVSWSLPPSSGLPIVFIRIQYRELNPRRKNLPILWNTLEDDIPPSTTSYVVKKLKTGATYHFRLAAVYSNSDNRHGPNSERFLVEAPDKSKPPAFGPIIVELRAISPSALSVSWQMAETQLPVSGFVIQYQVYSDAKSQGQRADQRRHSLPEDQKEGNDFEEIKISNPKKKSASIKGLQPSTPYTVRMFSYTKEGKSALSNSAVASTLPGRKSKESSTFPNDYFELEEFPTRGDVFAQPHKSSPEQGAKAVLEHFPAGNHSDREVSDDLRETVDLLRNERMLLIIACSVLSCFLIVMSLCFLLFVCLRDKFVFVVPFSKKVYSHPRVTDREVRTF